MPGSSCWRVQTPVEWDNDYVGRLMRETGLKDAAWQEYCPVLAMHLDRQCWASLGEAYQFIVQARLVLASEQLSNDRLANECKGFLSVVEEALNELHRADQDAEHSGLGVRISRSRGKAESE